MDQQRVVLRLADFPLLEAPDGMMRDSILITDQSCGSENLSAGLVWVSPHGEIHEDTHAFDEVYYVIRGSAEVVMDGRRVPAAAGDLVFLRAGVRHRIENPNDETFQIFWLIATRWGDLHSIHEELGTWPKVSPGEGWHLT
jgi:mannose-6-phosphate isomerase-like protein (cupin superfamily)